MARLFSIKPGMTLKGREIGIDGGELDLNYFFFRHGSCGVVGSHPKKFNLTIVGAGGLSNPRPGP